MAARFFSIDGIDGCGKSTQIQLLADWLQAEGHSCRVVRDPGGTKLGEALREILLHRQEIELGMRAEMLMYMSSRAQLVDEVIRPELDRDHSVIADRYLLANVVYQGSAGGLDTEAIWEVGKFATGGLMPDATIVLDLPVDVAQQRIQRELDRLESRGMEFMTRVREGYLTEAQKLGGSLHVVDADRPADDIHADIRQCIRPLIATR